MTKRRGGPGSSGKVRFRRFLEGLAGSSSAEEASELLEPLLAYDRAHNGDLIRTLVTFFDLGGNVSRSADALFLHRNGLAYRLSRVEGLLRIRLDDPDARLGLQVALYLHSRSLEEPVP